MKLIDKNALEKEIEKRIDTTGDSSAYLCGKLQAYREILKFTNTLEVKEVDNVWHEIDNVNLPQPDKNKIYCVFTNGRHILATVINHPQDEELLQWKCTEFPHHRYDMCEGDKYMQIV